MKWRRILALAVLALLLAGCAPKFDAGAIEVTILSDNLRRTIDWEVGVVCYSNYTSTLFCYPISETLLWNAHSAANRDLYRSLWDDYKGGNDNVR